MRLELAIVVPPELLRRQPARTLDEAALDLAEIDGRVQRLAAVMQDIHPEGAVLTGQRVHDDLGNGRAVGANILGELGWAAQDMLDQVLDGDLEPSDELQALVEEVIKALPALVMSYRDADGLDVEGTRALTNKCFQLAKSGGTDLAEELVTTEAPMPAPSAAPPAEEEVVITEHIEY